MKTCALLTCDGLENHILDEDRLEKALNKAGWDFQWVEWKNSEVDWSKFDCALIRTTWDYTDDLPQFLNNLAEIEKQGCPLFNDLSLVRWNSQKTYLKELSEKGIATIPTQWIQLQSEAQLKSLVDSAGSQKVIVKPQVGAGAVSTFMFETQNTGILKSIVEELQGVEIMIQPFMSKVASEGEHSAHFFAGEFSHLVLKTPKDQDFRSQEEFGSHVRKIPITEEQSLFCQSVLNQIPGEWLYARVDFINNDQGKPCLIELELVEPSLYFRYDEDSADRLVQALDDRLKK